MSTLAEYRRTRAKARPTSPVQHAIEEGPSPCAYCGAPAEGDFSIHRDGFGEGPEVPLCNRCGVATGPSCEDIWKRISKAEAFTAVDYGRTRTVVPVDATTGPREVSPPPDAVVGDVFTVKKADPEPHPVIITDVEGGPFVLSTPYGLASFIFTDSGWRSL